jgi:lysophospholipase L1-like esterase
MRTILLYFLLTVCALGQSGTPSFKTVTVSGTGSNGGLIVGGTNNLYVFEGDSRTVGSSPAVSFPTQLMQMSRFLGTSGTYYNVAIGGTTLPQMAARYTANVHSLATGFTGPKVLFFSPGANDYITGTNAVSYMANFDNYVSNAKATDNFTVVIATIPRRDDFGNVDYSETVRAQINSLMLSDTIADIIVDADAILPDPEDPNLFVSDHIHYTPLGYFRWAQETNKVMITRQAIPRRGGVLDGVTFGGRLSTANVPIESVNSWITLRSSFSGTNATWLSQPSSLINWRVGPTGTNGVGGGSAETETRFYFLEQTGTNGYLWWSPDGVGGAKTIAIGSQSPLGLAEFEYSNAFVNGAPGGDAWTIHRASSASSGPYRTEERSFTTGGVSYIGGLDGEQGFGAQENSPVIYCDPTHVSVGSMAIPNPTGARLQVTGTTSTTALILNGTACTLHTINISGTSVTYFGP